MAEAKAPTQQPGTTKPANTGTATPPAPDQAPRLRLIPVNDSDQPVTTNTSSIQLAPGMAYLDFGFIEPGVLAALPRMARQGEDLPKEISGKLAVRVVMGFDGLANLQQQLIRVIWALAKSGRKYEDRSKNA